MKYTSTLIFLFFFFVFGKINIQAQRVQGGIIGGFNLSQVDGDKAFGYKRFGLNSGLTALVPVINENFIFGIETTYSQKGAYQKPQYKDTDSLGNELTGEYKLHLNYLEVPFLFLYNDKDVITAGGGFSYGRLVSLSEYEHGRRVETTTLNSGTYARGDFSILGDVRFRVYKKFMINFRYTYSLAKIRTREFIDLRGVSEIRKQYNNVITVRAIYMFNEKPIKAATKNDATEF